MEQQQQTNVNTEGITEAFESFFKAIQITDATNIVNYFLKNFCETEQSTNDNINRFIFVLKIKSEQIKSPSTTDNDETLKTNIELYKKSLIILGVLARYVKHSNSFSIYLKDIIEGLLLPHFIDNSDEEMKFEVLRSFTSLLQIYEDTIENYSTQIIQHLVTIDINRDQFPKSSIKSIIDFIVILMQASPMLIIKNIKLIESLIKIYSLKDELLYEDLTQVLGQFFQLYLPFKSSNIESEGDDSDNEEDDDDDEDETSMMVSERLKISSMGLENEIDITLLNDLSKQLVENIKKESSSIFLGILCGYSSIYIKNDNGSLLNFILNSYLSIIKKDDICNKENRKFIVNVIDSLRIGISNTCLKSGKENQKILIELFKSLLESIGDIREYVKTNQNKGTQVFYQRIRSSIILNLIPIIRIIEDMFEFAEEFLIYAPVLADPIIFSEFIISLNRNLNSINQQVSEQEYLSKKSLIQDIYLPKILNPLLNEIIKPIQKYKSMTIHIIQAIGNIALSCQLLYQPFIETTIDRLSNFVAKNWKSISKYAPSCIVTLDKLMQLFIHDQLYKSQYLETIVYSIYLKLLNGSNSIPYDDSVDDEDDDDDDGEEDENGNKKKNLDSDIISKIIFTILECLTNTLPKISNRLLVAIENQNNNNNSSSAEKNIPKDIYKYLMNQIGVEEVIFDADRFVRLAQLDLLNEIYKHFISNLPKSNHLNISIKHIFNEMLQIQVALELGEEELDKNGNCQRKDICLNTFNSIIKNSNIDKSTCSELLKEFINLNTTSNDIDKHQVKIELLNLFK